MTLRHVYRKHLNIPAPSGVHYVSNQGETFEAHTQEDYEYLLSLRALGCGCGKPKATGGGRPVYEVVSEAVPA